MKELQLPYSRGHMPVSVPETNLKAVLEPITDPLSPDPGAQRQTVINSLNAPFNSPTLEELSCGKRTAVIITSDHTRPVPSKITMPLLLESIRRANPSISITILIATGYHRASSDLELREKFGPQIFETETVVVHDAFDKASLIKTGILPSGGELWLNRLIMETDLLVAEGFIEPHFFAGFSGGRKSVLPGVAGAETVLANHCAAFIAHPSARVGILDGNPIHKDMLYAAENAKLAFILNVILNREKAIVHSVAGHYNDAHRRGCDILSETAGIKRVNADIVITTNGGYPLDQNIYQAVKGMTAAEACCRRDGIIIMVAACNDGHGGQSFYQTMANAASPGQLLEQIKHIPSNKTAPDQWEYQILSRILNKHKVILVTDQCDVGMIRSMHLDHAYTCEEALRRALKTKGKTADIVVIPDGVSVIVN